MKTNLTELLDACTPEELDGVLEDMDATLPADASIDRIRNRAMESAGIARPAVKRLRLRKALLVAAAIVAVAAVLVGCYVADVTEYNRAIEFFDLNSFSTEGLSRSDIKRVYRDITTESLSYDKSYEVIENNISADSVKGMDIQITNNTANNALYNSYLGDGEIPAHGTAYEYDTDYGDNQYLYNSEGYTFGYNEYKSTHISKYIDGEEQWITTFDGFGIEGYLTVDDTVLVYGATPYIYGERQQLSHIALIDDNDGTVLWQTQLDSEDNSDLVRGAVYSGSGFTLFGLADNAMAGGIEHYYDAQRDERTYLTVRTVNMDGTVSLLNRIELEDAVWIGNLTVLDDGYFVEIGSHNFYAAIRSYFVKISSEGSLVSTIRYGSNDTQYKIMDVFAYNGMVYLSAQARPIDSSLYEDVDMSEWETKRTRYDDDVLAVVREEFTSVLFVCNPDKVNPEQFFSVGGSSGGNLGIDENGNLRWEVKRIIKCGYSPMTSSFSFYGLTRKYVYTFDYDNNLLRQEKTGLIDGFRTF